MSQNLDTNPKTKSKPILKSQNYSQSQYQHHENHIKTNTPIPVPQQSQNFIAKTSKLVLVYA